jgi:cytochrome c551/c552
MNLRLASIIIILTFSCKTKTIEWKTLDFNAFKLSAPNNWSMFKEQGTDAYIGGLTNGKDSLWFYYGWYISGPKDDESSNHLYGQDTINGYSAVIVIPKQTGKGRFELFIPNVTERDQFALSGYSIKDTETVLQIFKSVTFENSDTTKNGTLTTAKFKEYPFGSGRTLYYGLCSSCHALNKNMYAPALKSVLEGQSSEWLNNFLKAKNAILRNDSVINMEHQKIAWFDTLTQNDVQQILGYVMGK